MWIRKGEWFLENPPWKLCKAFVGGEPRYTLTENKQIRAVFDCPEKAKKWASQIQKGSERPSTFYAIPTNHTPEPPPSWRLPNSE
jgi:hypothetical protein